MNIERNSDMKELFTLKFRLMRRSLTLDWLIDQFRHRKYPYSAQEIQNVYESRTIGEAASLMIAQALDIIDDYDHWLAGVSA